MAEKVLIANMDPNDPDFKKQSDLISIDMEVQRFDVDYSGIEDIEEVNDKTIAYLEKIIRKSYEYKQYVGFLKSELDITKCALTPTLDISELNISLEFHHYPLTLYDICKIVLNKMLMTKNEYQKINMFDVTEMVMKHHYDGIIGLVPLSKTRHEMVHNNTLKIPVTSVYGNFDKFVNIYKQYIDPEIMDKIQNARSTNIKDAEDFNKKLETNILSYDIKYNDDEE